MQTLVSSTDKIKTISLDDESNIRYLQLLKTGNTFYESLGFKYRNGDYPRECREAGSRLLSKCDEKEVQQNYGVKGVMLRLRRSAISRICDVLLDCSEKCELKQVATEIMNRYKQFTIAEFEVLTKMSGIQSCTIEALIETSREMQWQKPRKYYI